MGTPERPEREGERDEKAESERGHQRLGLDRRRQRQRDQAAEQVRNRERQSRADHEPDRDAEERDQRNLGQIHREHGAAGSAHGLEDGDRLAFAIEIVLDRVGDADATDQQRSEPHEREKIREALYVALELRRSPGTRANLPAGLRQTLAHIGEQRGQRRLARIGEFDPVGPAHEASRLQEPGRTQRLVRDQKPRPESETHREPVWLRRDPGRDL